MGVEYAEMQGFPIGRWQNGYFDGQRRLKVAWNQSSALLNELEGTSWPYSDGDNYCTPYRADIRPMPNCRQRGSDSIASYDYAIIDMYYTTRGPRWQPLQSQYIEERISSCTKSFKVNTKDALEWADGTEIASGDAPTIMEHGLRYDITYDKVTSMPSQVMSFVGYVNNNSVYSPTLGMTFAADTLMYVGADVASHYSWGKLPRFKITYKFDYWPYGHHMKFRSGKGYEVMYDTDGNIFYPYLRTAFSF
jgi:hypothetical protein